MRGVAAVVIVIVVLLIAASSRVAAIARPEPAAVSAERGQLPAPAPDTKPATANPAATAPVKTADNPAQPPAATAPKPEPTGLERLSPDWPTWLKVNLLYRGRVESTRTIGTTTSTADGYYLNRLRLSASIQAGPWVQVAAQIHDTAAMGYELAATPPPSASGGFDLRTGYVEIGRKAPRGATLAGGRMEYTLGDGRLVASADWGNASRTFDMGRLSAFAPGVRIDVFRSAPVVIDPAKFDRVKPGEYFWGTYATLDKIPRVSQVDAFAIQKANSIVTGESGASGEGRVNTYGARLAAPVAGLVSWDGGVAVQRGHWATDGVSAWAAHAAIAWTLSNAAAKPKVAFEYAHASGDRNASDGVRQTFDQLYASNHGRYGVADLIGWKNMHAFGLKFEVSPVRKLKVNAAWNRLMLATVSDAWYGSSGSKIVLNTKATSRDIGWEPDLYASYTVSKEMALGAGIATLLPGDYVRQSARLEHYWYPYATWILKF